jgi:hypothetical protein
MTSEEERGLFQQLIRIEQKIDWIAGVIISAVTLTFVYWVYQESRDTWASKLFEWGILSILAIMASILHHTYDRIETRQRKEDERREAAELERRQAEKQKVEEKRKDLEQRWREFRGSGLFSHKKCREWAISILDLPRSMEETGEWRSSYASQLFIDDFSPPPFVLRFENDIWKALWEEKMLDCHDKRETRHRGHS